MKAIDKHKVQGVGATRRIDRGSTFNPGTRAMHGIAHTLLRIYAVVVLFLVVCGCSMSEEMKRIEQMRAAQQRRDASRSTNLTGEQVFMRSCNTCHPQGRAGLGPSLGNLPQRYSDEASLKAFLRKGKGIMPPQRPKDLNDEELNNLIDYLKTL